MTEYLDVGLTAKGMLNIMKDPENPENEAQRLATLHATGILDTPAEERFDRISRMAQRLFNVPIALVSIVDSNRQWFKSCIGLEASETSREISFCGHAILEAGVFVIEDTQQDERFSDNPLVTEDPKIRFYAGAPLRIGNSLSMGTLCIIDRKPRHFTGEDQKALRDLADIVVSEMSTLEVLVLDELSGTLNRRGFYVVAKHQMELAKRNGSQLVLAYIDLNGFKYINDNFGHVRGDEVLKDFAYLLNDSLRRTDIVSRIGGDEFVVLMVDNNQEGMQRFFNQLEDMLSAYNNEISDDFSVQYAVGSVEYDPERHESLDQLLAEGDRRMYQDKLSTGI